MNITRNNETAIAAIAAASCLTALWLAPAYAEPGSCGEQTTSAGLDVADLVAMRKTQMAHDFVAYAQARAARRLLSP